MGKKYRIGYTTGVFDMFHVGHLAILKRAKEQCRYLIVGVSSDELVEEYKRKIPIIGLEDRMRIISSVRYVDEVVVQENMDKVEAWEKLHYDVLFHGDDWKDSKMYNNVEWQLKERGVEVIYLPHTPGISTTIITEVVRSKEEMNPEIESREGIENRKTGGGYCLISFCNQESFFMGVA